HRRGHRLRLAGPLRPRRRARRRFDPRRRALLAHSLRRWHRLDILRRIGPTLLRRRGHAILHPPGPTLRRRRGHAILRRIGPTLLRRRGHAILHPPGPAILYRSGRALRVRNALALGTRRAIPHRRGLSIAHGLRRT